MEARSVLKPDNSASGQAMPLNVRTDIYPLKETGVDWLTVTAKEPDLREALQAFAVSLLHVEHEAGFDVQPWNQSGFSGLHAGGVAFGELDQMSMCRLSGIIAYGYWRRAFELSNNCSRIDVQVTVGDVPKPADFILLRHHEAIAHHAGWTKPPTIDLRLSNRTSPTLYLNQRTSASFGRVYDKGNQSKMAHYVGCVRYECQFNGRLAMSVARGLARERPSSDATAGRVYSFFSRKGVVCPWLSGERGVCTTPRRRTNDDRRLAWLKAQVRPSIQTLLQSGRRDEVLEALGL